MVRIASASCEAQVFSIMLEMLSGPLALEVLMLLRSFSIPGVVMRSGGIGCLAFFLTSGRDVLLSCLVKTDLNWSTSICALSLLSLSSCPICFIGATLTLS